jgi:hypothetical protein
MQEIPVFIGGFRSGTTLLINLLGMHPQITPWFETKELCEGLRFQRVLARPDQAELEKAYCAGSKPAGFELDAVYTRMLHQTRATAARLAGGATGKAAYERYPLGNDYVRYSLLEAEDSLSTWRATCAAGGQPDLARVTAANGALIRALGTRQRQLHGGASWINKTPEISRFAVELRAALGRCRVIYMVRDGIEVVASGYRLGWAGIGALAFTWKALLEGTRAAMRDYVHDYLELRYEQLVTEPALTLDRVLDFCGHDRNGAALVQGYFASQGKGAFDVSHLRSNALDAAQSQVFDRVAGEMQAALGYTPAVAALSRDKAMD